MKIKWIKYNRKRIFLILFLFLLVVGITFGYAIVNTKLSVDGVAKIKKANWSIKLENYDLMDDSVSTIDEPIIDDTSISFSAKLDKPGDFYGFTIDVVNDGTMDAVLDEISITPDFSSIDYIDYSVSYSDDSEVRKGDIIDGGSDRQIKVYFGYVEGIDDSLYPQTDQNYTVKVDLNYIQYVD